jgi:hypothetical protein
MVDWDTARQTQVMMMIVQSQFLSQDIPYLISFLSPTLNKIDYNNLVFQCPITINGW